MFKAWFDFFKGKFSSNRADFVSIDATKNFELNKYAQSPLQSPPSALASPYAEFDPYRRSLTGTPDYFGKEVQREYTSPTLSFSTPRAPSQSAMRVEWDPRATHARGGLRMNPIQDEEDHMKNRI
jgi:hypothetical protein